jgi:hypothetical protein
MASLKDLTGQVFERLTVLGLAKDKTSSGGYQWFCKCTCGNTKTVASTALVSGSTKSCGCLRFENFKKKRKARR